MKKTFYSLLTAVALLGATSCSNDEATLKGTSDEATVTITAELPAFAQSRAFSDGLSADDLSYGVYEVAEDGSTTLRFTGESSFGNFLSTTVNLRLITGKTYDVVFWAQNAAADCYTVTWGETSPTMKVDYAKAALNNDNFDAFFTKISFTVTADMSTSAVLTRPFSQINVGTNDLVAYSKALGMADGEIAEITTAMTVKTPYTMLDLSTGEASEPNATDVVFEAKARPENEVFPISGYEYLAMAYVLQGLDDDSPNADIVLEFADPAGNPIQPITVAQAPLERNYRTNIYGSLLTSATSVTVTKDPEYLTPDHNILISTPAELTAAINAGGEYTLVNDLNVSTNLVPQANTSIDLNGHSLNMGTKRLAVYNGLTVKFSNGTISNSHTSYSGQTALKVGNKEQDKSTLILEDVTVNTPNNLSAIGIDYKSDLTLKNCDIKSYGYAVATNASTPDLEDHDIIIDGSTLSGISPVLLNTPNTRLTMTNSTVNGSNHGVIMRGGSAKISDCELNVDVDGHGTDWSDLYSDVLWADGNRVKLAAIVMGNRTKSAYRYPTDVTLENVKLNIVNASDNSFPNAYIWANPEEGNGVSLTIDDATKSQMSGGKGLEVGNVENVLINGAAPTQAGVQ